MLLLTAQGMAFARGHAPAEGKMVLCVGAASIIVFVDADGQPTSPPQLCADGFALFSAIAAPALDLFSQTVRYHAGDMESRQIVALYRGVPDAARGPPWV